MTALVLVELLTPDPSAMTAANAVRLRLGRAGLRSLRRRTCIEVQLDGTSESKFDSAIRAVLAHSIVLANPNKESAVLVEEGLDLPQPAVLVWDLMNDAVDRGLPRRLARIRPEFASAVARRAVLWTAEWSDVGSRDGDAALREIAVGDGGGGLLVNPHANGVAIVTGRLGPGDIERHVMAGRAAVARPDHA